MCTGTCDMAATMWIVKWIGNTVQRDTNIIKICAKNENSLSIMSSILKPSLQTVVWKGK